MSVKKKTNRPKSSGSAASSPEQKYQKAASRLFQIPELEDAFSNEPYPEWFIKIVERFGRIFAPDLKLEEFKSDPHRIDGFIAAFGDSLVKQFEAVDLQVLPDNPLWNELRDLLAKFAKHDGKAVQATVRSAQNLPTEMQTAFFAAYGEGLNQDVAGEAQLRLKDSNTAKMCFFLIWMKGPIEAKAFGTVAEMFQTYCKIHAAFGKPAAPPSAIASLKQQFSTLCSENGIKLAKPGQPKSK